MEILTPDDLMAGTRPRGQNVVVYDDDHYYMAGVLAELLVREGSRVTLVTPAARASEWADNAMEQERIQKRLLELGVEIVLTRALVSAAAATVTTACAYTGREEETACDSLLLVTARIPDDAVMVELLERRGEWADAGLHSARAVGDAYSPGTVAAAVWDGRRFAEELDEPLDRDLPTLKREVVELAAEESAVPVAR
jgi:dimethylamine/trimethylamine dehydrogenase